MLIFKYIGERCDFILHANQAPGFYWIHVRGLGECEELGLYQLAILQYQGTSELSQSPKPGYSIGLSKKIVSTVHRKGKYSE